MIAGTFNSPLFVKLKLNSPAHVTGEEGFVIYSGRVAGQKVTVIASEHSRGMLYGVFHFLRMLQTHQPIAKLSVASSPRTKIRILNHWDNLDRTVERGYAGFSLWDWHKLPDYVSPAYVDYARANASIGKLPCSPSPNVPSSPVTA